jgi:hypothetical protein
MGKAKSKAIVMVADGMTPIQDRRFENLREWRTFTVPKEQADSWLQYLSAESKRRGWGCSSFGQMESKENSGSITVSKGGPDQPQFAIVWERKRGGPIKVRYRSTGAPDFPLTDAEALFERVNELCRGGIKERVYCWGQLVYEGLPWRGELWLGDALRLGPPARQDETCLLAPRVILIDAQVEGIDLSDALSRFRVVLRELSVFLSLVMRTQICVPPDSRREWTYTVTQSGNVECDVRSVGYREPNRPAAMPTPGQTAAMPLVPVPRPYFSPLDISIATGNDQQRLPADIVELWKAFQGLPPELRKQFLQVGSMWQAALSLGNEYQTTRFAWMVAACEALKPTAPEFKDHNADNVVESLLGKPIADLFQGQQLRARDVRNAHFHTGEFCGSEFVPHAMMSSFQDPTFDHACGALARIASAAMIEWLQRGGRFTMPPRNKPRRSWRRWVREHALLGLPIVGAVGLALGWLLRFLWSG